MGDLLLHNPWVHFYLLYVAALVVINIIDATTGRHEPAGKTSSVAVEAQPTDESRIGAA